MCGLFGMSLKAGAMDPEKRAILLATLARKNDQRGGCSYSIVKIKEDSSYNIYRGLGEMANHCDQLLDTNTLFAHTRQATRGAKTVENAHAFEIGNIIGSHNGMIHNYNELEKKYPDRKHFEVDSQHLFAQLNDDLPFDELEGYGAIEWIKKEDPSRIYLSKMRNGQLTIWGIGDREAAKTEGIVWSSDEKHLLEAFYCIGEKRFFPYNVEEGATYLVKNGEAFIHNARKLMLRDPAATRSKYMDNSGNPWMSSHAGYPGGYEQYHKGGSAADSAKTFLGSNNKSGSTADDGLEDWNAWDAYCRSHIEAEKAKGQATAEAS
jgi:hypothetical protein